MKTRLLLAPLLALAFVLPAFAAATIPGLPPALPPPGINDPGTSTTPADEFFATLAAHCGQAFAGRVLVDQPAGSDDPFAGRPLLLHLHECSADTLRIGLHVGTDRSRTWVLGRRPGGLHLAHEHRHEDGRAEALSGYGGDSRDAGTATRQEFPADAASVALFARNDRAASQGNVWALELGADGQLVYELRRADGRLLRIGFDLRAAVLPPPRPWGETAAQ